MEKWVVGTLNQLLDWTKILKTLKWLLAKVVTGKSFL